MGTIECLETDSGGVYETHVVAKAGYGVIVQGGKDSAVGGTQTRGGGDNHGGPDGQG